MCILNIFIKLKLIIYIVKESRMYVCKDQTLIRNGYYFNHMIFT